MFVAPEGVLDLDEIPELAGLLILWKNPKYRGLLMRTVKEAPKLHREKFGDDRRRHARDVCYWRLHRQMRSGGRDVDDHEYVI